MRFWRALSVMWLMLTLAGCGVARWFSGGASNLAPPAPLVAIHPKVDFERLWNISTGNGAGKAFLTLAPALADGTLYVADHSGQVSAYAAASGDRLWRVSLRVPVTGATGYGNSLVLVGTRRGQVWALNAVTGAVVWKTNLSGEILAAPVASRGTVVVASEDGHLTALSSTDGHVIWSAEHEPPSLSLYENAAPVIDGNTVYTGFANGEVIATNLTTGAVRWRAQLGHARGTDEIERLADVVATPIIADGVLYEAPYRGSAAALDASSGRTAWETPLATDHDLALADHRLFVVTTDDTVEALSPDSGGVLWVQKALHGRRLSAPGVFGNTVAVGDYKGWVHLLDSATGDFVARRRVSLEQILAAPVAGRFGGQSMLFVLSQSGRLTALVVRGRR